ncbi:MAG TPA: 6-carboxytetrahydropterin synthase [Lacipirellulaceae bacterium]|nr:6-carboxytetrahydropterin synthase [Lacipirellulaceae bacterium]
MDKAEHVFSAAHFITFGPACERLHGHNYRVAAEFHGPLDENHLVIDFLLVRAKLREIVAQLDHYVLLPTQHPQLKVEDNGREVIATLGERRWIFPSGDCRLLPMANTTAEMLAAHIGRQLIAALEEHGATLEYATLEHIRIEVDECDGQVAVWERQNIYPDYHGPGPLVKASD